MTAKPLILGDNLYEAVALHPTYLVVNPDADDVAGHEAFHVSDNLRDLTYWTPTATNTARTLITDAGSGNTTAPTMLVLDRGHNLAGKTITIASYSVTGGNYITVTAITATIPSTAGGLPSDANGCLAADGTWWKTFTIAAARAWGLTAPALGAGISPIITGLYLGTAYRFPEYMNAPFSDDYDTDLQVQNNKLSRGGLRVMTQRLNFRRCALSLDLESTDYASFDAQARPLLRYGQPWWICFDDSDATHAGMIAPFQVAGNIRYQPQANPVHREIRSLDLEEVLPRLYT